MNTPALAAVEDGAMSGYVTQASLSWLEAVLAERYGHAFQLRAAPDGRLCLALPGAPRAIRFDADPRMFSRSDSALPCARWDAQAEGWRSPLGGGLPAPGAASLRAPLIAATDQGHDIAYDVPGLVYWMLCRQEEVGRTDLDAHGRFPARASHAFRHGYLTRPVVDEWLDVLGQVIVRTWPGIALKAPAFRVVATHDADHPSRYGHGGPGAFLRAVGGDALRRRHAAALLRSPWIRHATRRELHPADPYNTFDWLMDVSEAHGRRSAFYFICGRTDPARDGGYEIEQPAMRALLRRIHARGHEIGLHPSYGTYLAADRLAQEAQRLRRVCAQEGIEQDGWGGRMHYLRWRQPDTLRAWEQAGMAYDSTLGYADHVGFRCGTCHEYPAFDPVSRRALQLRIRPLIAMEGTVFSSQYMGIGDPARAIAVFEDLKTACRNVRGDFVLLWHNSELWWPDARAVYRQASA